MTNSLTKILTRMGIIAGLYTVISLIVLPISSGAIQVRISEALSILPVLFPEAIVGLAVGCALSNLLTGCAVFDIIFGSLITLVAGGLTYLCTRKIASNFLKILIGGFFPVVLNATLLPLIWVWCYGAPQYIYPVQMILLLIGQALSVYLVGTPTFLTIQKLKQKGIKFLQ